MRQPDKALNLASGPFSTVPIWCFRSEGLDYRRTGGLSPSPGEEVASSGSGTTTAMGDAPSVPSIAERPYWHDVVAPYVRPRLGRSLLDLATSVVPYLALSVLMYLAVDISYFLVFVAAVPAAGFLLRTYIVFHDCAHGSFLRSKRANIWLGVVLGLLVYSPF